MKSAYKKIKSKSKLDEFKLYPIGDIHCGTVFCNEDALKKKIREIKDNPKALWVGMGDYGEFITPNDKRWDCEAIADWVKRSDVADSQEKHIIKLLRPIAPQCIGLLAGNHELDIRLRFNDDVYRHVCEELEVPLLGYSCMYRLVFERNKSRFKIDCHFEHGSGAAQTDGGVSQRLAKEMNHYIAEIYAMGHLHRIEVKNKSPLGLADNMEVKAKHKVGAVTGCWFMTYYDNNGYPSYAEIKAYEPNEIGCPEFVIFPNERHIEARSGRSIYKSI
jgi:hypothetical protein